MRWLLGTGLVLLVAHGAVRADPNAPQVSPLPGRREDAQRLRAQLRGLDHVPPAAVTLPSAAAAATTTPAAASTEPDNSTKTVAWALLSIAGVSGVSTLGLVIASSPGSNGTSYDTIETVLGVTAVVTGTLGLFSLARGQSVQVAPTVTPKAVGLAISGRL